MLIGGALIPLVPALVVAAFMRGLSGAIMGVLVVAAVTGAASSMKIRASHAAEARRAEAQAQREAIESMNERNRTLQASTRANLKQPDGGLDAMAEANDGMAADAKKLPPHDAHAVEILTAFNQKMLTIARETRAVSAEMETEAFNNPYHYRTEADVDARIAQAEAFRAGCQRMLALFPGLQVRLKGEMTRADIPVQRAEEYSLGYIEGLHIELAQPMAQANADYADLLKRQFSYLKAKFGTWQAAEDGTVSFRDPADTEEWNKHFDRLEQKIEECQTLQRKLLDAQQADLEARAAGKQK